MAEIEVGGTLKWQGDRFTIELARGQKGSYGWTIKVRDDDKIAVLAKVVELDLDMRARFAYNGAE